MKQVSGMRLATLRRHCRLGAIKTILIACSGSLFTPALALAQNAASDATALAKQLANPIASLTSVPLQYNSDSGYGSTDDGEIERLNIQPVVPISLDKDWNLITRTIIPVVAQNDIPVRGQSDSGLGDIVASQFFSPKAPTGGGWIWGVGPVELLPTATQENLGAEQFGLGPTGVALKQVGPWTYGVLANHIWSVFGDDSRDQVNATFLQPFLAVVTSTKTTFSVNTESTYDWEAGEWSVPLHAAVSQMLKLGPQILQLQVGARYWADAPPGGPDGWGLRIGVTLLYPKK